MQFEVANQPQGPPRQLSSIKSIKSESKLILKPFDKSKTCMQCVLEDCVKALPTIQPIVKELVQKCNSAAEGIQLNGTGQGLDCNEIFALVIHHVHFQGGEN